MNWRDIKHPLSGGAEICLLEHAKYWHKKGIKIIWFSSLFPGAMPQEYIGGVNYIRMGNHFTVHLFAFWYYIRHLRNKIDIVVDNFHFIPFFTPLYINNKKIIAFIHEVAGAVWFLNLPFPFALLGYKIEPFFFKFYINIPFITVSNSTKSELLELSLDRSDIYVVQNGVNLPKINLKEKKTKYPSLLFLGRISLDKGIKDALKSFAIVKKSFPTIKLTIVGKGENGNFFKGFLKDVRTLKDADYKGHVSEKEKWKLLKQSWLLINPSKKEGWGLTVLEAASFGIPTIGYNVAGLRDSIRNMKTGLLTKQNTAQGLAQTIIDLLRDSKLYVRLSKQSQKFAKQFTWDRSGKMSFIIIKKVANQI